MDRQDTYRNLLIAAAVFLLIWLAGQKFFVPPAQQPRTSPSITGEPAPGGDPSQPSKPQAGGAPSTVSAAPPAATPSATPAAAQAFRVAGDTEDRLFVLGAAEGEGADKKAPEPPYRMRLVVSNVGASVEAATLTDHAQRLGEPARYELLAKAGDARRGYYRSLAVEKIIVDDVDLSLHDVRWRIAEPATEYQDDSGEAGQQVTFQLDISQNDEPAVRLIRVIRLPRQSRSFGRHDLFTDLQVRNLSGQSHKAVVVYRGGAGVRSLAGSHDDRVIDVGIRGSDGRVVGHRHLPSELTQSTSVGLYTPSPSEAGARLSWAAIANTYFTCTVAPLNEAGTGAAETLAHVAAVDLDGSLATSDDISLRFVTRPESIQPGQTVTYRSEIYIGEKDGEAFRSHPAYQSRNYYYQIAQGFGYCTFSWLVELMILLLNGIYRFLPNYGVAIIILVFVVRILLHPITKKGQVNLVRMQKQMGELGPKLEEIKKKFANDKARAQQETMRVYREQGINPGAQFLTCLPMLLQMPIWVALYLSLSNNIGMRHQPFVGWIRDLTVPDALYTFASPWVVPLFGWQIASFNLLPILVAVGMYLQQKLQPKPPPNPNLSPQQREQQEMMQKMMPPMMVVMMLLIFYNLPSGLNLYVAASSFFGSIEQWLIRRHIAHHESAGTLIRRAVKEPVPGAPKSKGLVGAWLERLQKKAEEAQRLQRSQRARPRR